MTVALRPLPYRPNALEPHISAVTVTLHHGQHEAGYVDRVNQMITHTSLSERSLDDIVRFGRNLKDPALFNAAAQAWNHAFYWESLSAAGGGRPYGAIAGLIEGDFGRYETFAKQLHQLATTHFGSGWAWIVVEDGRLGVTTTHDAGIPPEPQIPLLAIDVWEHSYYLDYRNRRSEYVAAVIDHLLNWEFVNRRLSMQDSTTATSTASLSQDAV